MNLESWWMEFHCCVVWLTQIHVNGHYLVKVFPNLFKGPCVLIPHENVQDLLHDWMVGQERNLLKFDHGYWFWRQRLNGMFSSNWRHIECQCMLADKVTWKCEMTSVELLRLFQSNKILMDEAASWMLFFHKAACVDLTVWILMLSCCRM